MNIYIALWIKSMLKSIIRVSESTVSEGGLIFEKESSRGENINFINTVMSRANTVLVGIEVY